MSKTELFVRKQSGGMFSVVNEAMTTGSIFWVDSSTGTDGAGYGKNPDAPVATIDYAIGLCTASKKDTIYVMPGHAETYTAAGDLTMDVIGVEIIGIGNGSNRPVITFGTDVGASVVVSAASCAIKNIVAIGAKDGLTNPFHVQAADFELDIEYRDTSSTVEAARMMLTTADADRLKANIKYLGYTGGNACVNAIRLVGCDGADIDIDFYGKASTAIIEFHTTACTDIDIKGTFHNSGTALTKSVVDTVTSSTWTVKGFDSVGGYSFSGGSGNTLAADDISGVTDALYGANGIASYPTGAAPANNVSLAEVLAFVYDGLFGTTGLAAFPTAAAAANDVSLAEVLRYMSELQMPRTVLKESGDLTAFGTSKTLFTVTGDVLVKVGASVDVAVTSTSGTTTLEVGIAGNTASLLVQDAVDNTAFDVGDSWSLITAADANGAQMADEWLLVGNGVDIILTGSVDDITAGEIDFYCQYIPLTSGSSVVAAA